jgi:hypothetical protein
MNEQDGINVISLNREGERYLVADAVQAITDGADALKHKADTPEEVANRQRHVDYCEGMAYAFTKALAYLTGRTIDQAQEIVAVALEHFEGLPAGELAAKAAAERALA